MIASGEIQRVRLDGPPRERGRAQGEALRPLIALGLQRWKDAIHRTTGLHPDDYLDRFLAVTDFMPAIERWASHLLDEVRGIGEGAGVSFRDIYAYQLMDEEWLFRAEHGHRSADGEPAPEHCSVVGVCGQEAAPPILAQNMDLPKHYDGTQALLHVTHNETGLEALVFTPAGLIATTGLNSRGIGVCVNTLAQLGHARRGLPVAFIARRLIEQESLPAALHFVRNVPHASGQNYALGGPDRIMDVEGSAHKVVPFMPGAARLYHTNHPLTNDDHPSWREDGNATATTAVGGKGSMPMGEDAIAPPATELSNSEQRFAFLESALADPAETITVDRVKAILRSREVPICLARESPGDGMTLGSLVMELSVPPVLHLAPGPPATTAYYRWTF